MRIEQASSLSPSVARRGPQAPSGDGRFAEALSQDSATTAAGAAKTVTTVDNLFILQEVAEDLTGRRKAVKRGDSMLDRLDDIRIALLTGSLPRGQLESLRRMAKERGDVLNDPLLQSVLDEIELRVAVELAKLDQVA